ncbi:MFS transporter [Roseomonas frigidaquae]|uniref:MFS transporter n=1 Tax=Falsiroseomonas frigidaquae TaxID=487318 RepID=A0ABX1ETD8_9PROT|nr:MFS transporter [Falsiroseomonas frigidaquae]NKE43900.1 MFS transporter [Falsiroseomonas frigidaquae]
MTAAGQHRLCLPDQAAVPHNLGPPEAGSRWPGSAHALAAAYLGWTLDAFDFFVMVFVLRQVAASFDATLDSVAMAITLTLACRAIGALLFGRLADRFGRRPVLMLNVVAFAVLAFASGLAPSLGAFLVLRALFGVAMGGEWGVAASLVMESVPPGQRGLASGVLQAGYPTGYLLASLLYLAEPWLGWRGLFMVGILPALLALYIRRSVPESPDWLARSEQERRTGLWPILREHWRLAVFAILLMTALNFLGHGSQDLYPSAVLGIQHHLGTSTISLIMIAANLGALLGGVAFGVLSDRIGRPRSILVAVALALIVLPAWVGAATPLGLGVTAALLLFCVQGAWGVVPIYLNELSPPPVRATLPGVVYQAGNFLAAANANIQIWLAGRLNGDYGLTMGLTVAIMVLAIVVLIMARPGTDKPITTHGVSARSPS